MKKISLVLLLLAVAVSSEAIGQTLSFEVKDKKLVGKDIVVYNKPIIQANLSVPLALGCNIDLFWLSGFNKQLNGGPEDEISETGWCAGEIRSFKYEFGVSHFNLAGFDRISGDVVQPYLELGKRFRLIDEHYLTPFLRTEVLIPIEWRGVDAKTGALIHLGVKHQWDVSSYLAINHRFAFVYDTGSFVKSDRGLLGEYNLKFGWKITDKITVDLPTFRVFTPVSDIKDGRKTNTVFGSGITFRF